MIVYTKPGCAPCAQLKKYLKMKNVDYEERDTTNDAHLEELTKLGVSTVPTTVIGDSIIVGYNLMALNVALRP